MCDPILVGGKIPFHFDSMEESSKDDRSAILHNLRCYLQCFLDTNVFGRSAESSQVIKEMFITAQIDDDHRTIIFSFPETVRDQFLLKRSYTVPLTHNDTCVFYCEELCIKTHLACKITVNTNDEALNNDTVVRLRHLLLRTKLRIKKISIGRNKKNDLFDFRITFNKSSHKMVRESAENIDEAITKIASYIA